MGFPLNHAARIIFLFPHIHGLQGARSCQPLPERLDNQMHQITSASAEPPTRCATSLEPTRILVSVIYCNSLSRSIWEAYWPRRRNLNRRPSLSSVMASAWDARSISGQILDLSALSWVCQIGRYGQAWRLPAPAAYRLLHCARSMVSSDGSEADLAPRSVFVNRW
jgi:hypothetical protein